MSDIGICNHAARLGMHCGALGITGPSLLRGSESPCSKSPTAVTRRFEAPEAPHLLEVRLIGLPRTMLLGSVDAVQLQQQCIALVRHFGF
jgi:hypothetical protein